MNNMGLSSSFVNDASSSFRIVCLELLERAYAEVLASRIVTKEWDENAISEAIVGSVNANPRTIEQHITAISEKRLLPEGLANATSSVDNAYRIDIKVGGFGWKENECRTECYMEAKNLYCHSFIKHGNKSLTSHDRYAQRYIDTGIDNLLNGHYPSDTLLLGYVLVGTVQGAVELLNKHLIKNLRRGEKIVLRNDLRFKLLKCAISKHSPEVAIKHCFLSFDHRG